MTQSINANNRLVTPSKRSVVIPRWYSMEDRERNEERYYDRPYFPFRYSQLP
ncbi:uncharacterized protein HHUB_2168 [Halobacterium hubeiense]|uniref:Uncharacterized protein n=1 Tax=Halobacterium hubeiense TaxID=1407499 RepID=A0A0U5HTH8_9EURY|nr:uncharacterized protein HHUB_2168 [Halobacterium hubeiense]